MKEQFVELAGTVGAALLTTLVVTVIAYVRTHVQNKLLRSMLDAVIKGVEEGDHPETKKSIQVVATARGVQDVLDEVVQKTTGEVK